MKRFSLIKKVYVVLFAVIILTASSVSAQFTLSGTVTDSALVPISAVSVLLFDEFGGPIGIPATVTDASGFYSIAGLPIGIYGLEFVPSVQGHLGETFTGISVSGNTTFDVMLAAGYNLSGFVRDSLGQGIFDIDLNVYEQVSGNKLVTSGDNTDINGFYHITVPPGEYRIRYRPVGLFADPWLPIELNNVLIASDTSIDVTMTLGYEVSGIITQLGGAPVVNADLDFTNSSTGILQVTPGDNTDGTGFYSVVVPLGTYDVNVTPQAGDPFVPLDDFGVVISGATTLNYTLESGLLISGTITNSLFNPIELVDIDIVDFTTGTKLVTSGDKTDASGFYQVIVPSGTYNLIYQPQVPTGLAPAQFLNVLVMADYNQDVVLADGIFLSGVMDKTAGGAVVNSDIDVKVSATQLKIPIVGDNTDASGAFTVVIETGTYDVEFEPLATDFLTAQKIFNVSFTQDTTLFVTLDTGLVLSGTVTDNVGSPVSNAEICVAYVSTGDTVYTPHDKTNLFGQYSVLIPSGSFNVFCRTDTLSGYIDSTEVLNYTMNTNQTLNLSFTTGQPACCVVVRGNVDYGSDDGTLAGSVDIADLVYMVAFSFQGGSPPPCFEEADIDGSGIIDISDIVGLVSFMFGTPSGAPPVACP